MRPYFAISLLDAIKDRNIQLVQEMLDSGADVKERDSSKKTPLHIACENGQLEIARVLLERGASLKARDAKRRTPLHAACRNYKLDVVRLLLEKSVSIKAKDQGERLLCLAQSRTIISAHQRSL